MTTRKVAVEFLGDASDLSRAARQGDKAVGGLGGKLKKVGLIAGAGLAAGAFLAGKALLGMAKSAAEDEASQKRLALQLRNSAGATDGQIKAAEKWISAQGRALGVTDDELRPALAKLTQATGDVGEAQKLAALAMDASAARGKSLEATSKALADAEQGRMGGLAKLGIVTKNAAGETLSLDQIHKNMAKTFKGAAASSADTFEGKMGRLKLAFDEAKESVGAKLLPILMNLGTWFLDVGLPAMSKFGGWIKENLFPIFEQIGAIVRRVMGQLKGEVTGNMDGIKAAINDFVTVVRTLWSLFGKDIVRYTKNAFKNAMTVVKGVLQIIGGIIKVFSAVLKGDWGKAWDGVKQILRGAGNVIKGLVSQVFNIVGTIVRAGGRLIVAAVKGIPGMLRALGGVFLGAGKHLIGQLVAGMKGAAGLVSDIAGNIWGAVKGLMNSGIDKINSALEFKIDLPFGKSVSINPPNIPHLARGTTSARAGWTWVGEKGPELVNMRGGAQVVSHRNSVGMAGGSDRPIIVQLVVDGKVLHQSLVKRKRDLGGSLGLA